MSNSPISEAELLEEIRRDVKKLDGGELSDEQILRYLENPGEYIPPEAAVRKIVEDQIHLSRMLGKTSADCSDEHAIFMLRYPFIKENRRRSKNTPLAR